MKSDNGANVSAKNFAMVGDVKEVIRSNFLGEADKTSAAGTRSERADVPRFPTYKTDAANVMVSIFAKNLKILRGVQKSGAMFI